MSLIPTPSPKTFPSPSTFIHAVWSSARTASFMLPACRMCGLSFRLGGQILVFDPETFDFLGVFVNDLNEEGEIGHLNRPDSLVFSPDGKLYVTSFRASEDDSDSIRIYDGHTGVFLNKIELYTPPSPPAARAFAQGILFGPGGKLFIAIAGGDGTTRGTDLDIRCEDEDAR